MTPNRSASSSEPPVTATPEAVALLERLRAAHGPLSLFQSGGCCEGSSPICLAAGDLPPGPGDVLLGEVGGVGGVPFYVDAEQYRRWRAPRLLLDVGAGAAGGFSLEGLLDVHFVSRER
jgi:uncharacterized protein